MTTNVYDQIEAFVRQTVRARRSVCEAAAREAIAQGCGFYVVNYRDRTVAAASRFIAAGTAVVSDQYETDSQPHERNTPMAETQDPRTEAVARAHAGLGVDEAWPTNEALGGGPTGTRDDEFRASCMEVAQELLTIADNADPVREGLRAYLDELHADLDQHPEQIAARLEEILDGRQ